MFCNNCGAKIEDGVKFCGACGETVAETPTGYGYAPPADQQPPGYAPVPGAVPPGAIPPAAKKNRSKLIGIGACALALILVIWGAVSLFGGDSPEAVIKKYAKAMSNGDIGEVIKLSSCNFDNLIKEAAQASNLKKSEYIYDNTGYKDLNSYYKASKKEMTEYLKDNYGSNYKITVTILNSEKVSRSDMEYEIDDVRSYLRSSGYNVNNIIKLDKITEMREYDVRLSISGRDDSDTDTTTLTLVKINGKWKIWTDRYFFYSY